MSPSISRTFTGLEERIRGQAEVKARANGVGARFGCFVALLIVSPVLNCGVNEVRLLTGHS